MGHEGGPSQQNEGGGCSEILLHVLNAMALKGPEGAGPAELIL